jgi:hypothetical protein
MTRPDSVRLLAPGRMAHVSDDDHTTAAIADDRFDLPYALERSNSGREPEGVVMSRHTLRSMALIAWLAAAACSASGSAGARNSSGSQGALAPRMATAPIGNACDRRLVTKDDVAGIFREPIARMKSLATDGDAQSCAFETAGFASVTISLRPGLGNATVDTWASGRMPASATPLAGVGDRAVWSADLEEVIATKHDLLCDIGVSGPPRASSSSDVVQKRLGDLCNKIFAHP